MTDQPALDGQYTVFGRVVEGLEVVQQISEAPADAQGRVTDRIEITKVTIRDAPPPDDDAVQHGDSRASCRATAPCSKRTRARSRSNSCPDKAPEHVRNFLRLASAGVYDGTAFHRVVQGFVIQTGMVSTRRRR